MRFRDWDEATSPAIKYPFLQRINTVRKISFWLQTLDPLHVVEHEQRVELRKLTSSACKGEELLKVIQSDNRGKDRGVASFPTSCRPG